MALYSVITKFYLKGSIRYVKFPKLVGFVLKESKAGRLVFKRSKAGSFGHIRIPKLGSIEHNRINQS
jgi:hypothetical protein